MSCAILLAAREMRSGFWFSSFERRCSSSHRSLFDEEGRQRPESEDKQIHSNLYIKLWQIIQLRNII